MTPTVTETGTITETHTVSPTITVSPTYTPEAYAHIEPDTGVAGDMTVFSYRISAKGFGGITSVRIRVPAGVTVYGPASAKPGTTVAVVAGEIRVVYDTPWTAFTNPNFDIITFGAVSSGAGLKLFESYLNGMPLALCEVPAGYSQTVDFSAPTVTGTPTITQTITPTRTSTPVQSPTFTATRTVTITRTVTDTGTETPVYSATMTPSITETPSGTPPTATATSTMTKSWTMTETDTDTVTETVTETATTTVTLTATPSLTPTVTNTITIKGIDVSYTDVTDVYYPEGMPSAPFAVYRFTNIGGADEPVYGINLSAYDEFNNMLNGSLVFGNIYAVDEYGSTIAAAAYPPGGVINLTFGPALNVPLQQTRSVYIYADMKAFAGQDMVKLSLDDEAAVSTNAGVSVSSAPGYGFKMMTKAVEIKRLTTVLNIAGFDLMPPSVSTGQQDVYAYLITISNPGTSQYSDSIITGITLTARNDIGALINADTAISSITLRDASTVFYSGPAPASSSIYCELSQPVTVTAGSADNIYAVINITSNTASHATGIQLSYEAYQAFAAREYHYPAPVTIAAAAGYSYPFESSPALILGQAAAVNVAATGTMPSTVSTGQQDVQAMSLVLTNTGNTSTASVMSTLMNFYINDAAGNILNPASFISAITVTSPDGSVIYGSTSSFAGGKIAVNLTAPVIISGGSPATLSVKIDVAAAYSAVPFTVVLNSANDIYAVDSNVFTPVSVTGAFPASGGLAAMQESASTVDLLNFTPLLPATVVKGQAGVEVFYFNAANSGGAQGADAEFTGFTVYITDILDAYVAASGALSALRALDAAGNTIATAVAGLSSAMDLVFTAPLIIPPGAAVRVTVYADINPSATAADLKTAVLSGAEVWVRDYNSKAEAAKTTAPVMPWRAGPATVLVAPATDLSVWHDGSFAPVQAGAGQPGVMFMAVSLYNDAFPGSASLRVSGITLTVIDNTGTPFAMASVLEGISATNLSGAIVYGYENVSLSASPSVYLPFTVPVDVPAAGTVTVYVTADISSAPTFIPFGLRVVDAAAVAASNLPSGAITVSAGNGDAFPMDSNLTAITALAYTMYAGHLNLAPLSVVTGQAGVGMLSLLYTNNNALPIGVTSVAIAVRSRDGAPVNADTVIGNIYLVDGTGSTIAVQAAPAASSIIFTPPAFTVPAGGVSAMSFVVDISASCTGSFYLELLQAGDVSTAPPASISPAQGDFFGNMRSGAPSIQPRNLELSYHSFPNPFNPDDQNMTLEYYLTNSSRVTITLYTIYGRFVKSVADNLLKAAGLHTDDFWDGKNVTGHIVKSGVYLCVLEVTDMATGERKKLIKKIVVLR